MVCSDRASQVGQLHHEMDCSNQAKCMTLKEHAIPTTRNDIASKHLSLHLTVLAFRDSLTRTLEEAATKGNNTIKATIKVDIFVTITA